MSKLPFVVQPRVKPVLIKIGTPDTGIFEIERRGYLNVAEKSFVDDFTQSSDSIKSIVGLATRISISKKISRESAYETVMAIISGKELDKTGKDVATSYEEEIRDLTASLAEVQAKRDIAIATVLLQSRVNKEWTLDDTLELDPFVIQQLSDLYTQEELKQMPETKEEEDTAELLGK